MERNPANEGSCTHEIPSDRGTVLPTEEGRQTGPRQTEEETIDSGIYGCVCRGSVKRVYISYVIDCVRRVRIGQVFDCVRRVRIGQVFDCVRRVRIGQVFDCVRRVRIFQVFECVRRVRIGQVFDCVRRVHIDSILIVLNEFR